MSEPDDLLERLALQNGTADNVDEDVWEAFDAMVERGSRKLKYAGVGGVDFGSPVVVRFDEGQGFDPHEEMGYLTTLPGHEDSEMDAVVHIPHTQGDKQDGGPVWITMTDLLGLPDVMEVVVFPVQWPTLTGGAT